MAFISLATKSDICIATQQQMSTDNATAVLNNLLDATPSDVIVTFLGSNDISALQIQLVIKGNLARHLTWILAYPEDLKTDEFIIGSGSGAGGNIRSFRGALAIKARENVPSLFTDYAKALRVGNNQRNAWFQEYIEKKFNCDTTGRSTSLPPCDPDASISETDIEANSALASGIIESVTVMALGMTSMLRQKCPGLTSGMCAEFLQATPEEFQSAVRRVVLTRGDGSMFRFNDDHTVLPAFDVWNYQGMAGFIKVRKTYSGIFTKKILARSCERYELMISVSSNLTTLVL